jgi:hypothetical protein
MVASIDQAGAQLNQMARAYGSYYLALREAGCPKRLARSLVSTHHKIVVLQLEAGRED